MLFACSPTGWWPDRAGGPATDIELYADAGTCRRDVARFVSAVRQQAHTGSVPVASWRSHTNTEHDSQHEYVERSHVLLRHEWHQQERNTANTEPPSGHRATWVSMLSLVLNSVEDWSAQLTGGKMTSCRYRSYVTVKSLATYPKRKILYM